LKETVKAVAWMLAGAFLLIAGWFAYAQFVLVPRLQAYSIETEGNEITADSRITPVETPPAFKRHSYRHSTMSYLYIPDAAPAEPDEYAKWRKSWKTEDKRVAVEHAISGHRIAPGSGMVLNYQRYSDDVELPEATDRAVFEKLTIFFPENLAGEYGDLRLSENPKIIAFWSRGSPDLAKGIICSGYASSGEIEYRRVSDKLEAKITLDISPNGSVQPDGRPCSPFTFRKALKFWRSSVENLEPWNGGGWGNVSPLECAPSR